MTTNLNAHEKAKRKRTIKGAVVFVLLIVLASAVVLYAQEYFATESLVEYKTTEIKGDTLSIILTEKTKKDSRRYGNPSTHTEEYLHDAHYGYFLELYDSAANKSLDKIEFKAPVQKIQNTPKLIVFSSGTIWMVSTNFIQDKDEPGFILKFTIENNKIISHDFKIDEKYFITGIDDDCVLLSDGSTFGVSMIDRIFGCTYLDLETENIVVIPPYNMENENSVSEEDFLP
jgi:hypothetical protein